MHHHRRFNVTGLCVPEQDYMCDISAKVSQTVAMVERGDYLAGVYDIKNLKSKMVQAGTHQLQDGERTDVIVDYNSEQFIVELKLWYGDASHENALDQIAGYLDSKSKSEGYLLTFDFRKRDNIGKPQVKWIEHKGKHIFDCMAGV